MKITIAFLVALLPTTVFAQLPADCADPSSAVPLTRAYHPKLVDHYLEQDPARLHAAVKAGYKVQRSVGRIFKDPHPSTVPLYRLYHPKIHDNMYTPHPAKRAGALKAGYTAKGVAGYVYPDARCGGVGLRTLWSAKHGDHFYTTLAVEQNYIHTGAKFTVQPWVEGYLLPA